MARGRGLGRGLAALIPGTSAGVDEIDIELIVPNPHQPRLAIDEGELRSLADSIREHGVLQPLLVSAGERGDVYQLIAGERRLRAAQLAGLKRVPVVIKEVASAELLELALVENLQRQDLSPLEEAQAYRRLHDEFTMTQEAIGARVGRSRAAVANAMRLLSLSDEMKDSLALGEITEGHARALLAIEDAGMRRDVWRQVVERGLTVRQAEELARRPPVARRDDAAAAVPAAYRADPDVSAVEERIRAALGTKVELRRRASGRGQLVVHFYSDEELNALLARFGVLLG